MGTMFFKNRPREQKHFIERLVVGSQMKIVIGVTCVMFMCGAVKAQFEIEKGKGYVLCERLTKHVNRVTENGMAARLWNSDPLKRQLYLTKELASFPEFTRPPFEKIPIESVQPLLELMGEVDKLSSQTGMELEYGNNESEVERYIADRQAGIASPKTVAVLQEYGMRFYRDLKESKAKIYLHIYPASHHAQIMQIEYVGFSGETVALLRAATEDLKTPLPYGKYGDSASPSRELVIWMKKYFIVDSSGTEFFVDGLPRRCSVLNRYRSNR